MNGAYVVGIVILAISITITSLWDDVVRDEFEVSKDYRLICGIAIGYPSDSPVNSFQANRIDVDELLLKAKKKSKK